MKPSLHQKRGVGRGPDGETTCPAEEARALESAPARENGILKRGNRMNPLNRVRSKVPPGPKQSASGVYSNAHRPFGASSPRPGGASFEAEDVTTISSPGGILGYAPSRKKLKTSLIPWTKFVLPSAESIER